MNIQKLEKATAVLKTIAHPVRLEVISLLKNDNELTVNEISEKTGCEQSLASHHLTKMRVSGILGSRREGKNIYYFLKEKEVINVIKFVEKCDCNY